MELIQPILKHRNKTSDLGYMLAFHCAPAIEGIKPANLLSVQKERFHDFTGDFHQYASKLHRKGVYFCKLTECPQRVLLFVYNRKQMATHLADEAHKKFLAEYGYEVDDVPLNKLFRRLRHRIEHCPTEEYPHEIGVFLGYPLEDVKGFIRHRGDSYKLCGYWKVYHNPAQARLLFHTYDKLRHYYTAQLSQGETIHTIHLGGTYYEQGSGNLLVRHRQYKDDGGCGGKRGRGCHIAAG